MSWLVNAAPLSDYTLFGLFVLIAVGRLIRLRIEAIVRQLPRRSQLRHYLMCGLSAGFFALLMLRGCYMATVIVDTGFRADPFKANHALGGK